MNRTTPKTFLLGYTHVDENALFDYLKYTSLEPFWAVYQDARRNGVQPGEALCSLYAKLCYKALTVEGNENVSNVRDIPDNIRGCFAHGHGSVFEHFQLNFLTTNCSRVFTHELVRHRVGTAFSQTSGRYVRSDVLEMVLDDPVLAPYSLAINEFAQEIEDRYNKLVAGIDWNAMDFAEKKKVTSALRRLLPNGQANEIGWSMNIRSLRHTLMMRTSRFAEWEIRTVFAEVYELVKQKFPLMVEGANEEVVDGIVEVTGLKTQPY